MSTGNVSNELKTALMKQLLTHAFMGMPALEEKTGQTRHHLNRVLRALIAGGWVIYQKKGRIVQYKALKGRASIPMPPLRNMGTHNKGWRPSQSSTKPMISSTITLNLPGHRSIVVEERDVKALYLVLHEKYRDRS